MNIKERVEHLFKELSTIVPSVETINPDFLAEITLRITGKEFMHIKTELERLWRVEECAQHVRNYENSDFKDGVVLCQLKQGLDAALAAKGQDER